MGFVPEIIGRVRAHKPFEPVVYFHGAAFVAWLCLLYMSPWWKPVATMLIGR